VPLSGQLGSEEMETLPMPLKGVLRHSPSTSGVGVSESGKLQLGLWCRLMEPWLDWEGEYAETVTTAASLLNRTVVLKVGSAKKERLDILGFGGGVSFRGLRGVENDDLLKMKRRTFVKVGIVLVYHTRLSMPWVATSEPFSVRIRCSMKS
jgi:hypothetical protein